MLTFLRKIRKSLIASGNARKYIIYAIGEIALVVIGILIALQINNWNEDQKKASILKVYLKSLTEDLEDDIAVYKKLEENSIFRYYSSQYLLQLVKEPLYDPLPDNHSVNTWEGNSIWPDHIPENYNKEFIQLAFLWTHRIAGKEINSSTIEELKSTGEYSFLRNPQLKSALNEYYADWNWRFGPDAYRYTQRIVEEWQSLLMDEGMINANPFFRGDPIVMLKNNPRLTGRLRGLAAEASWQSMSAKIIYEKAINLKSLIEQELNTI